MLTRSWGLVNVISATTAAASLQVFTPVVMETHLYFYGVSTCTHQKALLLSSVAGDKACSDKFYM